MTTVEERPNGVKSPKPTAATTATEVISLPELNTERLWVPIYGTSPLIVSNFSEKSKAQMLAAQQGDKPPKEKRNPKAEYERAFYRFKDGGFGFPTVAFKECTVGAARLYKGVTMKELRQCLFYIGEYSAIEDNYLTRIEGEAHMKEDVVRLAGPSRSADLRYRPAFDEWKTTLEILFITSVIDRRSVLSLLEAGGMTVGVGEWRPERRGHFGTFAIDKGNITVESTQEDAE